MRSRRGAKLSAAAGRGTPHPALRATFPPGGRLWGVRPQGEGLTLRGVEDAAPLQGEGFGGAAVGAKNSYRGWGKRPREPPRR